MKSSISRWVSGDDFFDRESELRVLEGQVGVAPSSRLAPSASAEVIRRPPPPIPRSVQLLPPAGESQGGTAPSTGRTVSE